jgi:hypothetical protein
MVGQFEFILFIIGEVSIILCDVDRPVAVMRSPESSAWHMGINSEPMGVPNLAINFARICDRHHCSSSTPEKLNRISSLGGGDRKFIAKKSGVV